MVEKVSTYLEEENGIEYVCELYSNGGVVRYEKPDDFVLPEDPYKDIISEEEQRQLEMEANIEYLVELAELQMEV